MNRLAKPQAIAAAEAGALPAPGATPLLNADGEEVMMDIANIEGQLRASSIRRTAELVDRFPGETLAILRGWMAEEA